MKRISLKEAMRLATTKGKPLIGRLPTTEKQPHWKTREKLVKSKQSPVMEQIRKERDIMFILDCILGRSEIRGYHSPGCNETNCADYQRCQELKRKMGGMGNNRTVNNGI